MRTKEALLELLLAKKVQLETQLSGVDKMLGELEHIKDDTHNYVGVLIVGRAMAESLYEDDIRDRGWLRPVMGLSSYSDLSACASFQEDIVDAFRRFK